MDNYKGSRDRESRDMEDMDEDEDMDENGFTRPWSMTIDEMNELLMNECLDAWKKELKAKHYKRTGTDM